MELMHECEKQREREKKLRGMENATDRRQNSDTECDTQTRSHGLTQACPFLLLPTTGSGSSSSSSFTMSSLKFNTTNCHSHRVTIGFSEMVKIGRGTYHACTVRYYCWYFYLLAAGSAVLSSCCVFVGLASCYHADGASEGKFELTSNRLSCS